MTQRIKYYEVLFKLGEMKSRGKEYQNMAKIYEDRIKMGELRLGNEYEKKINKDREKLENAAKRYEERVKSGLSSLKTPNFTVNWD